MSNWIEIAPLETIPLRSARVINTPEGDIAIFRTGDDHLFALDDHCPHQGGPLSQGMIHGHKVTCPLHNWNIDLESGEAIAPDQGCTGRHEVKIEGGMVMLKR